MKSKCIIQIKIGDNIITLDPGSNISEGDNTALASAIDVIKLRSLFASLKENVDLEDAVMPADPSLAYKGELLYNMMKEKGESPSLTPLAALYATKNPDEYTAIKAYVGSLSGTEVHSTGDFFGEPENAYKLSPYSINEIQGLFNKDSNELSLFKELMSIPGMSTLRISIAIRDSLNGVPMTTAKGVYMTPDNIVQIYVPSTYRIRTANEDKLTVKNFSRRNLEDIRNNILHEVTHAVYSELYLSNTEFKNSVDLIHEAFLKTMSSATNSRDMLLGQQYKDVHEFLADMFVSKQLRTKLASIKAVEGTTTELEHGNLYNVFLRGLGDKLKGGDKLLTQAVSLLDTSIPAKYIGDSFDKVMEDYLINDRKTIFFSEGINQDDINERLAPRDAVDSYGGVNAQAFWIQSRFNTRVAVEDNKWTIKDAYYYRSQDNPTPSQLDRLKKEDLVKIPWLRYQQGSGEGVFGRWVEQGVLIKDGKEARDSKGKLILVDITRDASGNIVQDKNEKRGKVEGRSKLVPVVYPNNKTGKVVVAKTGLETNAENGFNTVSIPYEMIQGIRKFNNTYFNHNENYEAQLKELNNKRKEELKKSDGDDKIDAIEKLDKLIVATQDAIDASARVKSVMVDYYKETAFSHKADDGQIIMNVSREDYEASNFTKKDMDFRSFVDPAQAKPLYIIKEIKKGKFMTMPNPEVFKTLWDGDSGSAFVADSEAVSEAVVKGDMVRVGMKIEIEKDGVKASFDKNEWFPVFQRLPNGIEVATPGGKGMIIPFNKIDAYGKNMQTEAFIELVTRAERAHNAFEEKLYVVNPEAKEGEAKRKYNKEYAKNGIKYSSLQFSKEYNVKPDEAIDDAMERFDKNQVAVRQHIKPYETFVKVKRKFFDAGGKIMSDENVDTGKKGVTREYQTNDLVVAKTDSGLVILNNSGKFLRFEYIKYDATLDDKANSGAELAFVMQDITAVKDLWDEFQQEKDTYEENKDEHRWINEGTKDNPVWKKVDDFIQNRRDIYDMYDKNDGVALDRLRRGDIIAIKIDKTKAGAENLPEFYYRKVVTVHDDGAVTVAEFANKDVDGKNGYTIKKGAFPRTVKPENIVKVGYKKFTEIDGKQELRDDLYQRRETLLKYAEKDRDWDDFDFKSMESAKKWNDKVTKPDGWHVRYVPLTKATVDYGKKNQETGEPLLQGSASDFVYLTKKLREVETRIPSIPEGENAEDYDQNPVPVRPEEVAWVGAWFNGNVMVNTIRGMAANTTTFKAEDIVRKVGKYQKILPEFLAEIMPGDWVMRKYKGKDGKDKYWASLIDRIENNQIYIINSDMTTQPLTMKGFSSIKTARRNDKFSKFKRTAVLLDIIKKQQKANKPTKERQSLEAEYKSPADSTRAIYEVGTRFQQLNPNVKINFLEQADLDSIKKSLGYDYYDARAFVLNGEVNINMARASVSDVIHEYAHLFLHALKYENIEMYNAIVTMTNTNPLFNKISQTYNHLEGDDLNEEVFVTVLGEYLNGQLKSQDEKWMDGKKELMLQFADYTKRKLSATMNTEITGIYDLDAADILTMSVEDTINLIGDEIMKNRLSNLYEAPVKFARQLEELKKALVESGQLKQECYG